MMSLRNKVIFVAGGSTGIGKATSRILCESGAKVVIGDINENEGRIFVEQLSSTGLKIEFYPVDVTDFISISSCIKNIYDKHGAIDGAFNNAGIEGPTAKASDYKLEEWAKVLKINLTGVFNCTQAEISIMIDQNKPCSIVNTASIAGLVAIPGAVGYNSAKHGVIGLTKTLALELAAKNIRVNAVCPGFTESPMLTRVAGASEKIREQLFNAIPMKRTAKPEEIGNAVAWLLSEESSYVTGIALPVDGGWMAQ